MGIWVVGWISGLMDGSMGGWDQVKSLKIK